MLVAPAQRRTISGGPSSGSRATCTSTHSPALPLSARVAEAEQDVVGAAGELAGDRQRGPVGVDPHRDIGVIAMVAGTRARSRRPDDTDIATTGRSRVSGTVVSAADRRHRSARWLDPPAPPLVAAAGQDAEERVPGPACTQRPAAAAGGVRNAGPLHGPNSRQAESARGRRHEIPEPNVGFRSANAARKARRARVGRA